MILLGAAPLTPALIQRIGFFAATCTTTAFVPQLLRVIKLKTARDVSLGTFLLFSFGVMLWTTYGYLAHDTPVLLSNSLTLVLSASILFLKIKYDRNAIKELQL